MNIAAMPDTVITRAFHANNLSSSIGAMLMDAGQLTPEAAEQVIKLQRESGLRFGEAAIQLGLVTEADIQHALSRQFDYPYLLAGDESVDEEVIAAFKPFSPTVERLRALRSQLMLRLFDQEAGQPQLRSLAVASPDQGEGRSWLAANLAVVFSQLGERTLLIDANLRSPRQHTLFRLDNQAGLSSVLAGRCDTNEAINRISSLLGLSVMPAGAVPPNPQELLSRPAFGKLLQELRERFDVVLIDTPAGQRSADAATISARAGAAIVVGRKHYTATPRLQTLVESLRHTGTFVVGAVLNEF